MNILIAILGAILAIFSVVLVHEFGHFLVARWVGVRVLRFSIGFGKAIWSKTTRKGTEFAIGWLPFGGYVRMLGEGDEVAPDAMKAFSYNHKNVWQRMAIVLAGPFMNFIFAIVLYWILFLPGVVQIKPIIAHVKINSIAAQAGFRSLDQITEMNHKPVNSWNGVMMTVFANLGEKRAMTVTVLHRPTQKIRQLTLPLDTLKFDEKNPNFWQSLGIEPYFPPPSQLEIQKYSVVTAWEPAFHQTWKLIEFNAIALGKMITGKVSMKTLGGPISIFQLAGRASQENYRIYLSFLAFLSVALGFINLLPIPGLDGGHFLFQCIELIFRRPVPTAVQVLCFRMGLLLLIFLILGATFNDLTRLFSD